MTNPYKRIIKGAVADIKAVASVISRIRANPTWTAGVRPTSAQQGAQRHAEQAAKVRGTNTASTARGYKGRNPPLGTPDLGLHIKPKKGLKFGSGGTIVYPENQDNVRRGKRPTIKYTPPPVTNRPAKPKPGTQILGSGPVRPTTVYPENQDNTHRPAKPKPSKPPKTEIRGRGPARPTIEYPEQQTHAVKRPKKPRGTIKYPAPPPANTGHGPGPRPRNTRAESLYERESR